MNNDEQRVNEILDEYGAEQVYKDLRQVTFPLFGKDEPTWFVPLEEFAKTRMENPEDNPAPVAIGLAAVYVNYKFAKRLNDMQAEHITTLEDLCRCAGATSGPNAQPLCQACKVREKVEATSISPI